MKKNHGVFEAILRSGMVGFAVLLMAAIFTLTGCGGDDATTPKTPSLDSPPATVADGPAAKAYFQSVWSDIPAEWQTYLLAQWQAESLDKVSDTVWAAIAQRWDEMKAGIAEINAGKAPPTSQPNTGGDFQGLTITGIDSQYNEKYAVAMLESETVNAWGALSWYGNVMKGVRISNGQVSIPLFNLNASSLNSQYTGSDAFQYVILWIVSSESFTRGDESGILSQKAAQNVAFSSGKKTLAWSVFADAEIPSEN